MRNSHVRFVALLNVSNPRDSAMLQAKTRITTVRMAVARLESMPLTPALASTAVRPANSAESNAQWSQFIFRVLSRSQFSSRNFDPLGGESFFGLFQQVGFERDGSRSVHAPRFQR